MAGASQRLGRLAKHLVAPAPSAFAAAERPLPDEHPTPPAGMTHLGTPIEPLGPLYSHGP
jgi:hypothetical protein